MLIIRNVLRRSIVTSLAGLFLLVTDSCRQETNVTPANGKITISFTAKSVGSTSDGRTQELARPEYLLVSISDDSGSVKNFEKLTVFPFGQSYVSEDIELPVGHYRLTDFYVMGKNDKIIYSTPKKGSALASLVKDPLDIEFDVKEAENTLVSPQVLAIEDAAKPGDFGYSSFLYNAVPVTAFVLPETSENIVKVSYEIRNTLKTFKGDVVPSGSLVDLNRPEILNTWIIDDISKVNIIVWTEPKECTTQYSVSPYQKVYRFTTELVFNGAAFQLPEFTSNRWNPYYYRSNHGLGFFFSANPLKSYNVEIQVPEGIVANYCWLDRRYWNASGGETCNLDGEAYQHLDMNGELVGKFRMKDQPGCQTPELIVIDSFVAVNSDHGAFHEFFSWTIVDGVPVPSCNVSSNAGRQSSSKVRPAPSRN